MSAYLAEELWHMQAACRGPNQFIFFPPVRLERRKDKKRREQRAKEICATCTVRDQCLQYAIDINERHGIWGGLTEKERRSYVLTPNENVVALEISQ